jgi:indole-3-acetate monooxygenase
LVGLRPDSSESSSFLSVQSRKRAETGRLPPIQGAIEVADFACKAAGVDAIFPGNPFERRFRTAHYEEVGQVLLGMPPEGFL